MEKHRRRRTVLGFTLFAGSVGLLASGCTYSSYGETQVTKISTCDGDNTPIIATFANSSSYKRDTDPAVLAQQQQEVFDNTSNPIGQIKNGNVEIGVGAVVCRVNNSTYYITTIGAQVMNFIAK